MLGSEFQAIVPVCLVLSGVHLGANYMSVRQLAVPTFDSQVRCDNSEEGERANGKANQQPVGDRVALRSSGGVVCALSVFDRDFFSRPSGRAGC